MTTSHLPLPLPAIDFSSPNLKPETPEWDSVKAQVRKALEEYGCFEALLDGGSVKLRKALFEATKEVFDLPFETKLNSRSDKHYKGYANQPRTEGMGFSGVDNPEVVHELTQKLWPQGNITFSKSIQSAAEKLIELNQMLFTMIMESFGIEKYVEGHLSSSVNHFYLHNYKGLDDDTQERLPLDSHIDRQFFTILCENGLVDSLEIQTKDGEEWINAKPSQDSSFFVLAGASLHVLLNGRVFPPLHRMVISGNQDRHSASMFLHPKEGVIITAPEEVVDDEHPRLYKPFNFETPELNIKNIDLSILKTYYGL